MTTKRLLPFTGIGAVVLVLVGHLTHSGIPDGDASVPKLVAYYSGHGSALFVGSVIIELAAACFVLFAVELARAVRSDDSGSVASGVVLVGGGFVALGISLISGIGFVLAHHPERLNPAALQAVHAIFFNLSAPFDLGIALFLMACGVAALRSGGLPVWLARSAVAIGAIALLPPPVGDLIGLLGLAVWILATSVVVLRRPVTVPRVAATA